MAGIKTYEIFTETYSKIIQHVTPIEAGLEFEKYHSEDDIIAIIDVERWQKQIETEATALSHSVSNRRELFVCGTCGELTATAEGEECYLCAHPIDPTE